MIARRPSLLLALGPSLRLRAAPRMVHTEAKIAELGLKLPPMPVPLASYVPILRTGNMVFLSGHVPFKEDMKTPIPGIVGKDFTTAQGAELAKLTALELVSSLKVAVGDLDRVRRIVKLNGYIACAPDFTEHPEVLNGASNLLGEIFGDRGVHARAAVGVTSLPRGVPVEIDLVVEIDPFGFPDKSN